MIPVFFVTHDTGPYTQAKGRVERANLTQQDRLVKELRLAGVSTMAEANNFVEGYIDRFNAKFGKPAKSPRDAHRPLLERDDLEHVFTWQEERKVSKNLTLQFKKIMCLIEPSDATQGLQGKRLKVCQWQDGRLELRFGDKSVPFREYNKTAYVDQAEVVSNKRLGAALRFAQQVQRSRDEERLASSEVSLADKQRIVDHWADVEGTQPPALVRRTVEVYEALAVLVPVVDGLVKTARGAAHEHLGLLVTGAPDPSDDRLGRGEGGNGEEQWPIRWGTGAPCRDGDARPRV